MFLYALGYIVVASAQSVYAYAVGNSIYILGITGLFLLQNIIISDISSTRNRLFFSILPSVPGVSPLSCRRSARRTAFIPRPRVPPRPFSASQVINVWVSGNITQSLLGSKNENASNWRWGIGASTASPLPRLNGPVADRLALLPGMFAILTPVLALPIMFILGYTMRQTKQQKADEVAARAAPAASGPQQSLAQKALSIFWQLDVIGLLLLVAGFGMVLVTVTIANGKGSQWSDGALVSSSCRFPEFDLTGAFVS